MITFEPSYSHSGGGGWSIVNFSPDSQCCRYWALAVRQCQSEMDRNLHSRPHFPYIRSMPFHFRRFGWILMNAFVILLQIGRAYSLCWMCFDMKLGVRGFDLKRPELSGDKAVTPNTCWTCRIRADFCLPCGSFRFLCSAEVARKSV
jgi:hypothetical protein